MLHFRVAEIKVLVLSSQLQTSVHRTLVIECSNPILAIKNNLILTDEVIFYGGAGGI